MSAALLGGDSGLPSQVLVYRAHHNPPRPAPSLGRVKHWRGDGDELLIHGVLLSRKSWRSSHQ